MCTSADERETERAQLKGKSLAHAAGWKVFFLVLSLSPLLSSPGTAVSGDDDGEGLFCLKCCQRQKRERRVKFRIKGSANNAMHAVIASFLGDRFSSSIPPTFFLLRDTRAGRFSNIWKKFLVVVVLAAFHFRPRYIGCRRRRQKWPDGCWSLRRER